MFPVKQTVIYTFFCHKGSKILPKHCFLTVFFVMLPVKHTVILHVFCYNASPKRLFFAEFSMLWHPKTLQNLAMYNVFFFSFLAVFSIGGKLPK